MNEETLLYRSSDSGATKQSIHQVRFPVRIEIHRGFQKRILRTVSSGGGKAQRELR